MDRVITVRGKAKMTVQPDFITVVIRLEEQQKDYQKAVTGLFDRVNAISHCAEISGLQQESIQTDDFSVHINRRVERDKKGNFKEINDGYVATQSVSIGFSKDMTVLAKLIQAISAEIAKPNLQIRYSVKEPSKLSVELLQKLSEDALSKAKTICESSGAALGKLMNVNYQWNDLDTLPAFSRQASLDETAELPVMATMAPSFRPKEIDLEETAVFIWEIADKNADL